MACTNTENACPATATAAGLPSLPSELLLEICYFVRGRHVSSSPEIPAPSELWARRHAVASEQAGELQCMQDSQARLLDLCALSRTCRALRAVAQSVLYASVSVAPGRDDDDDDDDGAKASARFSFLVRTLARRPDLGHGVMHVEALCSAAAVNDDNAARLHDLFRAVPNVATAHLFLSPQRSMVPAKPGPDIAASLSRMRLEQAKLPASLHTLQLSGAKYEGVLDLDCAIIKLGCLSALRVLELCSCSVVVPASVPRKAPPSPILFHDLSTLHLSHVTMSLVSIENLLRAVGPNLVRVAISVPDESIAERGIYRHRGMVNTIRTAVYDCFRALLPWAHSLRSFAYTVQGHCPKPYFMPILAELAEFAVLESLWLESAYFPFGESHDALTAVLPPMLKSLRLSGKRNHAAAFNELRVCIAAGGFPTLRHLVMDDQGYDPGCDADLALADSLCMLRAVGVDVSVLPLSP